MKKEIFGDVCMAVILVVNIVTLLFGLACKDFESTRTASIRRMGGARMESCLRTNGCAFKPFCIMQAKAFCLDAGMEPSCAFGEPEMMCW